MWVRVSWEGFPLILIQDWPRCDVCSIFIEFDNGAEGSAKHKISFATAGVAHNACLCAGFGSPTCAEGRPPHTTPFMKDEQETKTPVLTAPLPLSPKPPPTMIPMYLVIPNRGGKKGGRYAAF